MKFCPFEMKKVFGGGVCMSLGVRPQGSSTALTTAWSLASAVGYLQGLLGSSVVPPGAEAACKGRQQWCGAGGGVHIPPAGEKSYPLRPVRFPLQKALRVFSFK